MAMELMKMPQLGESVTEGTISKWLVKPGDHVTKYDPLAEVMTDKVNAEVPSSFTGIIKELKADENQTLAVRKSFARLKLKRERRIMKMLGKNFSRRGKVDAPVIRDVQQRQNYQGKPRYSPAVLKLSQEHESIYQRLKERGMRTDHLQRFTETC